MKHGRAYESKLVKCCFIRHTTGSRVLADRATDAVSRHHCPFKLNGAARQSWAVPCVLGLLCHICGACCHVCWARCAMCAGLCMCWACCHLCWAVPYGVCAGLCHVSAGCARGQSRALLLESISSVVGFFPQEVYKHSCVQWRLVYCLECCQILWEQLLLSPC